MKLVVACGRPGMIRGGVANPIVATYELDHFTAAQLAEMVREPSITVSVGHRLVADPDAEHGFTVEHGKSALTGRVLFDPARGLYVDAGGELGDGHDAGANSTLTRATARALGVAQPAPPAPDGIIDGPLTGQMQAEMIRQSQTGALLPGETIAEKPLSYTDTTNHVVQLENDPHAPVQQSPADSSAHAPGKAVRAKGHKTT